MTDYCASKFGLFGFSEALRRELKETRVLTVCPSLVETRMFFGRIKLRFPWLMPSLQPKELAVSILNALERGESELWVPLFVTAIPILRLVPTWLMDFLHQLVGSNSAIIEK